MKVPSYRCESCGYIYDPQEHNNQAFGDLDIRWECPGCQASQDQFALLMPEELEVTDEDDNEESEPELQEREYLSSRRVSVDQSDLSVFELHRRYKKGKLILQPDFQRYSVWSNAQASRLIESVFLNVPIPQLYLSEEAGDKIHVIDGQQRLHSFFRFLDNDLKLSGLEALDTLNGRRFSDLESSQQERLENYTLRVIVILRGSDPEVKFEIFRRLNTGGTSLNDQEVRNCYYRGVFNDFLKTVATYRPFLSVFGIDEPHPRMADVELALRFFAFLDQTYLKYSGSMKSFLNNQMERCRNVDKNIPHDFEEQFKKAIDLSLSVFGEYAFRRFVPGNDDDPNGTWEAGRGQRKFNRALYDIVTYGFTQYSKPEVQRSADSIREELIYLMTHDLTFIDSITRGTSATKQVKVRFKKWLNALDEIIGHTSPESRSFSSALKKQLYDQNPTCELCNQKIMLMDDAELHHHDHYWKGGRTIPSKARLVHRYCNRAEGGGV